MGRKEEALKELQVGEAAAVDCSESRHKIITAAIDKLKVSCLFCANSRQL